MTLYYSKHCPVCEQETHHAEGRCLTCIENKEEKEIQTWERSLTITEKINNLHRRIRRLENPHTDKY